MRLGIITRRALAACTLIGTSLLGGPAAAQNTPALSLTDQPSAATTARPMAAVLALPNHSGSRSKARNCGE